MLFLLILSGAVYVTVQGITLSCVPTLPEDQAIVRCTCKNPTKNGVEWRINSSPATSCSGSVDNSCFPLTAGYTSSVSDDEFYLEINPYSYTNCATYSCKDGSTVDEAFATTSIADFVGGVPSIKSEPGTGQNGTIEITTACLFNESDIVVNWYSVDGGNNSFTPEGSFKTATSCSDTTKVCSGTNAVTLNIGFTHTQKSSRCGKVTVEVYHSEIPSTKLEWTTTGTYCVGDAPTTTLPPTTDCICECDCECRTIVIVSIVFGILGALGLLIIVVGIPAGWFNGRETLLLASGVIGIVSDVLSLVLSIVVTVKECCECCEENCEDSGCCAEDSECCKDWIDNAAVAFIVIPCVAIVASVVIFVLVKLDIIRPGNDAYKAKEAKDPGENHGMTGTSM